jgi:hypothetical protein
VGCGIGMFLHLVNEQDISVYSLYGTEYSDKFRNYVSGKWGFNVTKEPEEFNKKFSFISLYHTLEHASKPDELLTRLKSMLDPNGLIYISVPIWMEKIINLSGGQTADDFEDYFHLNHINCFTKDSFNNLLKKVGLEVVRRDDVMLGATVLCKAVNPSGDIQKTDYLEVVKDIEKIKKAIELFRAKKFGEAIDVFPKYPDAYIHKACSGDNCKNFETQVELYEKALKAMPGDYGITRQYAGMLVQWDGSKGEPALTNNIRQAKEMFEGIVNLKHEPFCYESLMDINLRYLKNYKEALKWINEWKKYDIEKGKNMFGAEAYIYSNKKENDEIKTQ